MSLEGVLFAGEMEGMADLFTEGWKGGRGGAWRCLGHEALMRGLFEGVTLAGWVKGNTGMLRNHCSPMAQGMGVGAFLASGQAAWPGVFH